MISCAIIQDLLLMYAADECSEDSRNLIEEHLKTCEKCRNVLETFKAPALPPEDGADRTALDEKAREFNVRRVFGKIRRRWIASLLCVLMIFPLVGAGFMIRNQVKGEGVCFTNLHELYATHAFLKAVQREDYNRAFAYLDVERMYEDMTEGQVESLYNWDREYTRVKIGGRDWYVNQEVYRSCYQTYLSSGDEVEFWQTMMIFNSEHRSHTAIPKDQFDAAAALFAGETGEPVHTATADSDIHNDGSCYAAFTSGDGKVYYYPVAGDFATDEAGALMNSSFSIPASVYEKSMVAIKQEHARVQACAEYYKEMGLASYREMVKEKFLANTQKLKESGIAIESFSIRYLVYGANESWQIDVGLICRQDRNRSTSGGITAFARSGSLIVSGGFSSATSDDAILDEVMRLLSPSEDVSNYYSTHLT